MIKIIQHSFTSILKSMASVLLRYGITHQVFSEWSKRAFVLAAAEREVVKNKKQPNAAISVLTGLHRKEVKKHLSNQSLDASIRLLQTNRVLRVVQGWLNDKDFTENGFPKMLPFEGLISFSELNRRYSGDMKAKALFDEMEVNQMISVDEKRNVKLIATDFMPSSEEGKIEILGFDVSKLIETIHKNLDLPIEESLFQKKVFYDSIPKEKVCEFKKFANEKSLDLLVLLDQWLHRHDNAAEEDVVGVGLGLFYFEELENEKK